MDDGWNNQKFGLFRVWKIECDQQWVLRKKVFFFGINMFCFLCLCF